MLLPLRLHSELRLPIVLAEIAEAALGRVEGLPLSHRRDGAAPAAGKGAAVAAAGVPGGAEGVGRSTTYAVVVALIAVIASDVLFTAIFYFF